MYLRWQYLGPAYRADDEHPKSRRLGHKKPAEGQCRYRLAVVASRRDPQTHKPRAQVVLFLGVVDELALHPNYVGPAVSLSNRNALLSRIKKRLDQALSRGALTPEQGATIRAAVNMAFPKLEPPEGQSYVIVPARIRQKALARWEPDAKAAFQRQQEAAMDHWMMDIMRDTMRNAGTAAAATPPDPEEEKHRAALRQVRDTMAIDRKTARETFWRFCAEHDVPDARRDAVWQERYA
jgi:hypothetical protein